MLNVNLQFFAEGDPEEFDLDSFEQEFEEKWEEPEQEEETVEEDSEPEEVEDDVKTEDDPSEPEQEEEQPNFQNDKQNRAFADMRRQLQESQKYADFIHKIAEESGMKPEEILEQYENKQLERQSQEKGVPVDVLKRLNSLESENQRIREESLAKEFNSQVDQVTQKYGLKDKDLDNVFQYMAENNLDPRKTNVKFEDAYFLANRDTILAQEREKANQEYLANKKKRQNTSAVPSGTSDSPNTEAADIEADVLAYLKENGDI